MANVATSRLCSKCKDNIGSFNCEGCKEIFCTKHSIEHRQVLTNEFEELMTELNVILQQNQEKEQKNESLKKEFFCRIDEWENNMKEKVHEKAQQIRQRLDEVIDNKNKKDIGNIQSMMDEILKRYQKEDFLEHDIERIKRNINQAQQDIEKSTQQSDVQLYIEPKIKIDLTNLIYIEEKFNTASSSVTNKQSINKDSKGPDSTMNSNTIEGSHSVGYPINNLSPPYMPSSPRTYQSYIPLIRLPNAYGGTANFPQPTYRPPHLTASKLDSISTQQDKRERKPLLIRDPVSNQPVEVATLSSFVDTNHILSQAAPVNNTSSASSFNSSSTTVKDEIQQDFRRRFAELLTTRRNT